VVKQMNPIKVQIRDPETDELLEEKILRDDYTLICAGNRYLKSYQIWGSTVQLNVARMKPGEEEK
jgi:hypothetical protein